MQLKSWLLTAWASVAVFVALPVGAVPSNPDCAAQGISPADRQLVQLGKTADQVTADQKAAMAIFDKKLAACAKSHGWSTSERNRIEQLQLWTFMAEGQGPAVSKFGIWPDNVRDAVNELPQHVLGERSWVLKKGELLTAIETGLAKRGSDLVLLRASKPASDAVAALASNYAHARQERIKLGLEARQAPPKPAAKPVVVTVNSVPPVSVASKPVPAPAPAAVAAKAPPPPAAKPVPAKEPIKLVEIDYSPLLKGKLYSAEPWNCALRKMSPAEKEGWEADYRNHARTEAARDLAVQSCAVQHKWDKATATDVADYTLKWIISEELQHFLLQKDPVIDAWSEDIRKLADADLASAVGFRETPALSAVIQRNMATYGPVLLDKPVSDKEIESIMRLHKLWAQIESFHRRHGVKHP